MPQFSPAIVKNGMGAPRYQNGFFQVREPLTRNKTLTVMNKYVRQAKRFCLCHNLAFDTTETINASRSKQPDLD